MSLSLTTSRACGFASGMCLRQKGNRPQTRRVQNRVGGPVKAKYGDESQFFDLEDLENSVGSWDLYGQEDEKRYPSLQADFFERAAAPLERRESLIALIAVCCEKLRKGEGLKNELEQDLENTVGSWELYGYEDEKRYPYLQSEFFERAAAPLTRRSNIVAFIFGAGLLSILTWGAKGSKDVALPITVGPLGGGEKGPRGKI